MNPKFARASTARILLVLSGVLVPAGVIVIDPVLGVGMLVLAGILVSIGGALGTKRMRLMALVLVAVTISLAVWRYPEAQRHYRHYQERSGKLPEQHSPDRGIAR